MNLPSCIAAYFDADSHANVDRLLATLSPEAVVEDEHKRHLGREAIRKWWTDAKQKTPHVNQPVEATTSGDVTRVGAWVSGDFPGSPVKLQFAFTVRHDQILRLEIG